MYQADAGKTPFRLVCALWQVRGFRPESAPRLGEGLGTYESLGFRV